MSECICTEFFACLNHEKPKPMTPQEQLAEMREKVEPHLIPFDELIQVNAFEYRKLLDTLQAILDIPKATKCSPDDEETALINHGYNFALADVAEVAGEGMRG